MKLSRVFLITALLAIAFAAFVTPVANTATAQGPTATPIVVVITATPQGAQPPAVDPNAPPPGGTAPTDPSITGTPVPREIAAFRAARAALEKKLKRNLSYVETWTWEIALFPDSALGCPPPSGVTAIKGDTPGWKITIKPLGDSTTYEYRITGDLKLVIECGTAGSNPGGQPLPPGSNITVKGPFEFGGHALELNANTVAIMRSAKMKWVKVQVRLSDFGAGAGYIASAKANGFKILIGLVGQPNDVTVAGFFDQFAARAAELARAGADAIEVWNEPNLDREWANGNISGANYTQLLAKTYAAVKAANPGTLVISGAPAPTGGQPGTGKGANFWNDDVFMADMAAAGAGNYLDCVGLHYNEGIVSPTQGSGDPRDNFPTRYYGSMLARGLASFPGKQACWTELGFLTPQGYGPLPAGFAWAQNVTIAQHAQWLSEAAKIAATSGNIRLMIIWNVDFPFYSGSDPTAGYAVIRQDRSCPACAALAGVLP